MCLMDLSVVSVYTYIEKSCFISFGEWCCSQHGKASFSFGGENAHFNTLTSSDSRHEINKWGRGSQPQHECIFQAVSHFDVVAKEIR